MMSTMVVIAYLWHIKPFKSSLVNKTETFNELTVLFAAYPLLSFTDWMSLHASQPFGWLLITCISLSILFNITLALVIFFTQ